MQHVGPRLGPIIAAGRVMSAIATGDVIARWKIHICETQCIEALTYACRRADLNQTSQETRSNDREESQEKSDPTDLSSRDHGNSIDLKFVRMVS
jgi:hypothetical protein